MIKHRLVLNCNSSKNKYTGPFTVSCTVCQVLCWIYLLWAYVLVEIVCLRKSLAGGSMLISSGTDCNCTIDTHWFYNNCETFICGDVLHFNLKHFFIQLIWSIQHLLLSVWGYKCSVPMSLISILIERIQINWS